MYWRRKAYRKFAENPDLDGIKFKFEPDNKHDKYAVAIKFRGKLICYVPRRITAALSYYSREARRRVFVANLEHTTGELRFDICLLRGNAAFEDIPLKSKKPIKGKPCRDSVDCFIPPLVRAVKEMRGADKISALIASEKNLDRAGEHWGTPLIAAVNGFHLLLKLLICAGADTDFGYWQIRRGMPEDLFYSHTDRATPLQVATENGDVVAAKIILKYAKLSPEDLDFSAELASEKSGNAYPDRGNVYDVIGRKINRVRRRAAKARIGAFLKTRSIAGLTGGDIVEIIEKYPKMRKSWDVPNAWRKLSAADWARLLPVFEPECIRYCRESDGIGWRLRFRAKLKKLGSPIGLPEIFIPEDPSKRGKTIMIY